LDGVLSWVCSRMIVLTIVYSSVFNYLVDAYREWSASAMASNAFLRCIMAGGFPLFSVQVLITVIVLTIDVPAIGVRLGWGTDWISVSIDGTHAICLLLLGRDITKEKPICKKLRCAYTYTRGRYQTYLLAFRSSWLFNLKES
jgi:hypothetical protein